MAHIAGLVAAGLHPNPCDYAHIVSSTTHKTLRGPRGGIIPSNDEEIMKKINKVVFPGVQGGPLEHIVLAKAVAFKEALSDEFKEYMDGIADLKPQEKLIYLNKYFRFQIYRLFTDIVLLWVEEGGNILEMSTHITNSSRECEEYLAFAESINRRKTLEVAILWLFSLAIIIALRIALTDFYDGLIKQPIFLVSVCLLMLIVLLSAFLLVRRITKIEIKGIENDE